MKLTNNQKQVILLISIFIIAVYFWNSIIIYPIKLFVVLLHEMSHGIAAIALGGKIVEIQIGSNIGGYCAYTISPNIFKELLIGSAGYLGSIFWGGVILIAASKIKKDRYISLIIGIITLILSFFVIKSGEIFGIFYCFAISALLILSFKYVEDYVHDFFLKFIGLTSSLYVILDIKSDLIDRSGIGSDADRIAELIGVPAVVTGVFWVLLASIILYYSLKFACNEKEENTNNILTKM